MWESAEKGGYGTAPVDDCSCLLVGIQGEEPKTSKMRASTPSNAFGEGIVWGFVEVDDLLVTVESDFWVDVGVEVDWRHGIFPRSIKSYP